MKNTLSAALRRSNRVRRLLARIRASALPSLERLVCEMMAIHYCSDYDLCEAVLFRVAEEALSDPMAGTTRARMRACLEEAKRCGAKGIIVSRIPGASHCAFEARSRCFHVNTLPR